MQYKQLMESAAMVMKKITVDGKILDLSQEFFEHAQLIRWDEKTGILFFTYNNMAHKAKVTFLPDGLLEIYLFAHKQSFRVDVNHQASKKNQIGTVITAKKSLALVSPLAGRIVKVLVRPGDFVTAGQPLVVIESMKMENELCSNHDACIKSLSILEGDLVQPNQELITFDHREVSEGESDGTAKSADGKKAV
jgi:biotin carboxyl carrier protein